MPTRETPASHGRVELYSVERVQVSREESLTDALGELLPGLAGGSLPGFVSAKTARQTGVAPTGTPSPSRKRKERQHTTTLLFRLAGEHFHERAVNAAKARLASPAQGAPPNAVQLVREPANAHDTNALSVRWHGEGHISQDGQPAASDDMLLGYCPRQIAAVLSPLIDAGEFVILESSLQGSSSSPLSLTVQGAALSRCAAAAVADFALDDDTPEACSAGAGLQDIQPKQQGAGLVILSLFDGIAAARVALEQAKVPVQRYFASEIHGPSIAVADCRWPDTVRLGDIRAITSEHCAKICPDLVIGGWLDGACVSVSVRERACASE